ncbi:MAG: tetratricopeptide repeat protein [bacterium]|nr:tetratricopeptide repeat protein [bacterium]
MSLNNLSAFQSELGQHKKALASAEEALDIYWPYFERYPAAFANNVKIVLTTVLRFLTTLLGQPPTKQLVERLVSFAKILEIENTE